MSCPCVGLSQRAPRESIRNPTAVSTARAPAPCRIRCRHGIARIRTRKDKGSPGPPPENEEDPGRTAGVLRIRCAALLRSEEIVLARTDLDGHEAVGFRYRLDGRILGERLAALGHLPGRRSRNPDAGRRVGGYLHFPRQALPVAAPAACDRAVGDSVAASAQSSPSGK